MVNAGFGTGGNWAWPREPDPEAGVGENVNLTLCAAPGRRRVSIRDIPHANEGWAGKKKPSGQMKTIANI